MRIYGRRLLASVWLFSIMAGLSACGGPARVADSTPPPIDPDAVPDAVPRPDPILIAGNKSPYTVNGVSYHVMSDPTGYQEEGLASWYGLKFHGRKTSNGERFNVYGPTAAHKTLPIPSYVRVTNLENGRHMVIRVNDRGPFHGERIIDLSYGAALKLGFADQGTTRVKVEALAVAGVDDRRELGGDGYRRLQLGAFTSEAAARTLAGSAAPVLNVPLTVTEVDTANGRLYRLRAGPFEDEAALRGGQMALRERGLPSGQPLP